MRERIALAGRQAGGRVAPRCRHDGGQRCTFLVSVRILIVDDHAVVPAGLRLLSARGRHEPVGEAGNARDAVSRRAATKPDVILLDVVMPDESGSTFCRSSMHEGPDAKVLVLSMQDDPHYVREAFAAGASGTCSRKRRTPKSSRPCARSRAAGAMCIPRSARLVAAEREGAARGRRPALRPRARGAAASRARPHESGDREAALHLGPHRRDAPRAHHAEAPALRGARTGPLRARAADCSRPSDRARGAVFPKRVTGRLAGRPHCPARRRIGALIPHEGTAGNLWTATGARTRAQGAARIAECPADREDHESEAGEQERDPDHDPEQSRAEKPCSSCSGRSVSAVSEIQTCLGTVLPPPASSVGGIDRGELRCP